MARSPLACPAHDCASKLLRAAVTIYESLAQGLQQMIQFLGIRDAGQPLPPVDNGNSNTTCPDLSWEIPL